MKRIIFMWMLMLTVLSGQALAQIHVEFDEDKRHHLSVFLGGSYVDEVEETVFTFYGDEIGSCRRW